MPLHFIGDTAETAALALNKAAATPQWEMKRAVFSAGNHECLTMERPWPFFFLLGSNPGGDQSNACMRARMLQAPSNQAGN